MSAMLWTARGPAAPTARRAGWGYCRHGPAGAQGGEGRGALRRGAVHLRRAQGSGTIFFTGCSLGCAYCQNAASLRRREGPGRELSVPRAARRDAAPARSVAYTTLDTSSPGRTYIRPIAEALDGLELGIPVVWNSSGYGERRGAEAARGFGADIHAGLQVFLAQRGRRDATRTRRTIPRPRPRPYSRCSARRGPTGVGDADMLRSGVLIRHLILPGWTCRTPSGVIELGGRSASRWAACSSRS